MTDASAPPPDGAVLRTAGLAKTYGGRTPVEALRPLDLEVGPGETFGLLGPNGAGKTTLVKLLLGLVRPTAGEATLLGRPVSDADARREVGYLPEGHRFPPFLTGRETLGLFARVGGVDADKRARRAPALLDLVRLGGAADRKVGTYSKGMLQRLGIAQALMNRPRLVFLDEPTDGVDPVGRREIRELIETLRDDGVTVFLNSHLLSEVERVCTRVAILKDGALVREGTVDDLTRVGRAWRLLTTPLPPPTAEALGGVVDPDPAPRADGLALAHVVVPDRGALGAVLDRLRADGVDVEAVEPVRQSLEELFVEVVTHDDAPPRPREKRGEEV
ncbi:ABC transporter ATP-binding protein [Rubrivirga sp. S365]|uniref:ABC transporter ATP-binding protein n=1 Tax=Rubrivirga sp. S365 TaxID=3076080 RepID=UPI0028C569BB|nr:ABC transporter ATP-binding protein [Rubrivirga sp. S365]MDT7857549.1 ABC transporter ATP-binding protein [Rubrivirga sp. S365]